MNNFFNKISQAFKKKSLNSDGWLTRESLYGISQTGNLNIDKYKSYVFACINLRAENVAGARINMYQDLRNGKVKEIFEHPFLSMIKRENGKKQTFKNLLYRITTSLDLYGNAYLYVNRDITSSSGREPFMLYFLPFKSVEPVLSSDFTMINKYRYNAGGTITEYSAEDIIHFQIADPNSNLLGMPTVKGFNFTLDIEYLQELYQKTYFKNNAALGLVLETDSKLNDEEYKRLKNEITEQYEGAGKAGKSLLLEGGIKSKPYTSTPKDSLLVESRKQTRDDILSMFRVPKTLLGISDDVNLANANIALNMFTNYVIKPFAKLNIQDKLNSFLNSNYPQSGLRLEFDYDTDIERELVLKTYDLYMRYNIVSIDEIRELEGFASLNKENN